MEWIGVVSGLLYVWLAARQSLFCWPVSLLNLSVYFYVFFSAGLFADAGLQVFYLALTLYGWWNWRATASHASVSVQRLSRAGWIRVFASIVTLTSLLVLLLIGFTPSEVPWLDAHTTAVSLVAQALTAKKVLESWWLWVWANAFYCCLYLFKGLYPTLGLYALFIVLAVYGYREWKRSWISLSNATPS